MAVLSPLLIHIYDMTFFFFNFKVNWKTTKKLQIMKIRAKILFIFKKNQCHIMLYDNTSLSGKLEEYTYKTVCKIAVPVINPHATYPAQIIRTLSHNTVKK